MNISVLKNELAADLGARENKCSWVILGDANVSLQSSPWDAEALCVLTGWEIKQVTSGQKLVVKRRMQKGYILTLFSQSGFNQ